MLGGFDPRQEQLFFARKRRQAFGWALFVFSLLAVWVATQKGAEETVVVALEPEIQDFAVEEEKPVEEEPPPPPPENTQVKVTNKPKPKPKIKPPDKKQTDALPETNQEKTVEHPGGGQPGGTGEKPVEKPKPKPKAEEPKPKPVEAKPKPKAEPIDPTKPIDRPERASMPKPDPSNKMPDYPEDLRDAGITGEVVIKLHIHMDGSVKGAKILRKKSSATTDEEKEAAEKAFVAAVIRVIKSWKYEPAKLDGEPISIWFPVNFPFSLTSG
jgi:protein TonB